MVFHRLEGIFVHVFDIGGNDKAVESRAVSHHIARDMLDILSEIHYFEFGQVGKYSAGECFHIRVHEAYALQIRHIGESVMLQMGSIEIERSEACLVERIFLDDECR